MSAKSLRLFLSIVYSVLLTADFSYTENTEPVGATNNMKSLFAETKEAADKGDVRALFFLGQMYDHGSSVPQNYAEAMQWYLKAAGKGNADAMFSLGLMYYEGKGVPKDFTEAKRWFSKATDGGNAHAMFFLGAMFYIGAGAPKDSIEAYKWYSLSAAKGNKQAVEQRDRIQKKLTTEQLAAGLKAAKEWKPIGSDNTNETTNSKNIK